MLVHRRTRRATRMVRRQGSIVTGLRALYHCVSLVEPSAYGSCVQGQYGTATHNSRCGGASPYSVVRIAGRPSNWSGASAVRV